MLPGVVSLLLALEARPSTTVALLTGNHSHAARIKLERFGLLSYFRFGAFGEDAADRNDLVAFALERAWAVGVPMLAPRDVVVVGDTPLDVACGHANGAVAVAVATGGCSLPDLEAAGADLAVTDLSDTSKFLDFLHRS
ncbi:MAG: hypothetical protein EHM13_08855 [Acidobacteria bacterium]|nr:MAG: hypothetical protein EHM13_08855 [Acidobacteriota bacterium]